jgi:ribose transport system substrate-binding protein
VPASPASGRARRRAPRYGAVVAAVAVTGLALAACSSNSNNSSASTSASSSSSASSSKPVNVAYMSFAVENSYDAPMLAAAEAVASAENATVKVFDANNSPQTQYEELQTVISSGQYNGIIVQPIEDTNLIPLVQQAISKGIKVVNMDQILGTSYSTDAPQVTGLSANVTFIPTQIGTKLGQQVVAACAS